MPHGRIARAHRRYPDARRRAARYGRTAYGRRPPGLPPHLLPAVSARHLPTANVPLRLALAASALVLVALVFLSGAFVLSTAAAVGGTVRAYKEVNGDLPDAAGVAVDEFQTTRIFDRDGKLLQEVDDPTMGWRSFVGLDQVNRTLIDATIAAEDATFWTHHGVEPMAIARGVLINTGGAGSSGGSTITQQLVRGLYPEDIGYDISYTRKGREALAAVELERRYGKQDILTMYLNLIFYGNRAYGIEAAAQTFFQKSAKDLDLAEASLLAGLPQRPTAYNPATEDGFALAKERQRYVLDQMLKYRYITREERDAAWDVPLQNRIAPDRTNRVLDHPHFVQYVREEIVARFGEDALLRGGLQITTSIDTDFQTKAEEIVAGQMGELNVFGFNNAAMVVMVPWSGEVLAMVGSANYDDEVIKGAVNITTSGQQPGSAIKPIIYAAAFERGWNPGTVVLDTTFRRATEGYTDPVTGRAYYQPENYSGQHYGAISVRQSLANSLNIPAVKALEYAQGPNAIDLAHRMGMSDASLAAGYDTYGLAMALGAGEVLPVDLTTAYATLANNGRAVGANPILEIKDSQGNVLWELDEEKVSEQAPQGLRAEYAFQITSILTDNKARATVFTEQNLFGDTQSRLGRPTAAKSGTTNDWKDLWTMGYTSAAAVGVWVGNTDNQPGAEKDGIETAGPIWQKTMLELHQNPQWADLIDGPGGRAVPKDFPEPPGIYRGKVCAATGHRAEGGGDARDEFLAEGAGPALRCDQLDAYERTELEWALADLRRGANYVRGAPESIRRYAAAVGRGGGGSWNPADSDGTGPPDPPIVPIGEDGG